MRERVMSVWGNRFSLFRAGEASLHHCNSCPCVVNASSQRESVLFLPVQMRLQQLLVHRKWVVMNQRKPRRVAEAAGHQELNVNHLPVGRAQTQPGHGILLPI